MVKHTNSLWADKRFPIENYHKFLSSDGNPDLIEIHGQISRDFEAQSSGEYFARSLAEILETQRLDGCHEWGILWSNILRELGIHSTYIQGVNIKWLKQHACDWDGNGWRGHVFLRADLPRGSVVFCSTTARQVQCVENAEGQRVVDGSFVVLFEGRGPDEFLACTQNGINRLLRPLVRKWITENERSS
jgi:hypothetical protein